MPIIRIPYAEVKKFYGLGESVDNNLFAKIAEAAEIKGHDSADNAFEFIISTQAIDRDNDTIAIKGWNLKEFKQSGVVLWAHDKSLPPIAAPSHTRVDGKALKSVGTFATADINPFGHQIGKMVEAGLLKSTSVGFMPEEFEIDEERSDNMFMPAINFLKQKLLEWSVVPVASNPEAVLASAAQFDYKMIGLWTEKALDGEGTLVVPRSMVEEFNTLVTKAAGTNKSATISIPAVAKTPISWDSAHPDGTPAQDKDVAWDGPAQTVAAQVADLKIMSAFLDVEKDADTKDAYSLLHHVANGEHAVNWKGLTDAMGDVLGVRGPVIPEAELDAVWEHLAKHYRDDFNLEPPALKKYSASELKALFAEPNEKDILIELAGTIERSIERIGDTVTKENAARLTEAAELIAASIAQFETPQGAKSLDAKVVSQIVKDALAETKPAFDFNSDQARSVIAAAIKDVVVEDLNRQKGRLTNGAI